MESGGPVGRQKHLRDQENPQNVKVPGSSNGCYMDDKGCQYKISLCDQRDPIRDVLEDVCWPCFGSRPGCAMYQRYLLEDTVKKAADMRIFMQYMCVRRNREEIRRSSAR